MQLTLDRFAAMSVQYSQYSFDFFLQSMSECGIKNIEMWAAEPHYYCYDYNTTMEATNRVRELRKKMDDRDMKVVMYTPEILIYPFNPAGEERERRRVVDLYRWAADDALEFGTDRLFINPGTGLRDQPREEAWERAVDTVRHICGFAEKMGVSLYMEQLQPYESNLVNTSVELAQMIAEIDASNLHAVLDVGAMVVVDGTIDEYYEKMPEKIGHVHFSDRNHEALGDQDLPLLEYLEQIDSHGFGGYYSLEVNDGKYVEDPHSPFMRSADWLKKNIASA